MQLSRDQNQMIAKDEDIFKEGSGFGFSEAEKSDSSEGHHVRLIRSLEEAQLNNKLAILKDID